VSDKYEFIDAEKDATEQGEKKYTITSMCGWLGVSTSGYYEWRERPDSATARWRAGLAVLVAAIFEASDETYGYRRVHAQLVRQSESCTPEPVRGIIRELGLMPCRPRPWRHGLTDTDPAARQIPDLVARDFTADAPGEKMIGDITYVPRWEDWVYLATVIDCHTKAVVGWAMGDNYKTPLIENAIRMAARNYTLTPDAIFHSDRGSNYTSARFGKTLKSLTIQQSVRCTGICYDNCMTESFSATLKNELVHRIVYPTRQHATADIARCIELRYNSQRLHSALGYRTPHEAHAEYLNRQLAAQNKHLNSCPENAGPLSVTRWSAASTGSNATVGWTPATTNSPSATKPPPTSPRSTNGSSRLRYRP